MSQDERTVSVGQLVERINYLFSRRMTLAGIWIQGEVSNLTKHYTGHLYFTLKDEDAQIACSMWKTYASRLDFDLKEGDKVLAAGSLNVYEKNGRLSLQVRALKLDGIGALYQEFEQRKKWLEENGYFNPDHKKPKPDYMPNLAIVTGKEAAALQDVLSTVQRRWPMTKLYLYPALVQGQNAAPSMIRALKQADEGGHDAILLVRGGGSFEDLFCFNDLELVKTVYNLKTYSITGVGHEIDYTLVDYVSDHRAVTPTAAAQFATWDQVEVSNDLLYLKQRMIADLNLLIDRLRQQLSYIENNPYLADPMLFIRAKKSDLMHIASAMDSSITRLFADARMRLRLAETAGGFDQPKLLVESKSAALSMAREKLIQQIMMAFKNARNKYEISRQNIMAKAPAYLIESEKNKTSSYKKQIIESARLLEKQYKTSLQAMEGYISALSPQSVLERGYAAVYADGKPALAGLAKGTLLSIYVKNGLIEAEVTDTQEGLRLLERNE